MAKGKSSDRKRSASSKQPPAPPELPELPAPSAPIETVAPVEGGAPPPPSTLGRRGQIAAEKARFDLGPQQRVLADALGDLPPGYGLTFVRAWVRDPRYLVAVWDINSENELKLGEERGWQTVVLRLLSEAGETLRQIPVAKRNGIWHLAVGQHEGPLRIALGLASDGKFETIARSNAVRMPPLEPDPAEAHETLSLPPRFDRRVLVRAEPPPRPGYQRRGLESAAWRLDQRIARARRTPEVRRSEQPFRPEPTPAAPTAQDPPHDSSDPAGPDPTASAALRASGSIPTMSNSSPEAANTVAVTSTTTSARVIAAPAIAATPRPTERAANVPQPVRRPVVITPPTPAPGAPSAPSESALLVPPTRASSRRFMESKTPPRDVSSPRGGFSRERRDD